MKLPFQFFPRIGLLYIFITVVSVAHAASFDCAKAHSVVEKMVCSHPTLSQLDEDLALIYKQAMQREPQVRELQQVWLRDTRAACETVDCLSMAYRSRIAALSGKPSEKIPLTNNNPVVPPAPVPVPFPTSTSASAESYLSCPLNWDELSKIAHADPDQLVLGKKVRDWKKEHVNQMKVMEDKCQSERTVPEYAKNTALSYVLTSAYPAALNAIDDRDRRQQLISEQITQIEQEKIKENNRRESLRIEQLNRQASYTAEREQERIAQEAKQIASDQESRNQRNIWIALAVAGGAIYAWYWNKFVRARCPKCKSTNFEITDAAETDRWRGTKKVTEQNSRGSKTRHVQTTFVKKLYEYRCQACNNEWTEVRKEEL